MRSVAGGIAVATPAMAAEAESGLSPAAAGRQTDGRHEERGCINGRHTTAKVDSRRDVPSASGGHQAWMPKGETD